MNIIKMNQVFKPLTIIMMMFLVVGCQDNNKSEGDTQLLSDAQKEMIKQERTEFMEQIDNQMSAVDQQIEAINEKLSAMGEIAAQEAEAEYKENLRALEAFRKELETKKTEVMNATEENWEEFKSDMEPYLNKVESDIKMLGAKIEEALTTDEKK